MGSDEHVEVERKYVVDDEAVVPLDDGPDGSHWEAATSIELEAVYFDTADLDLLRRGVTLRRRTGGEDAGWHVKVPRSAGGRTELRHPLGRATRSVPATVLEPVRAIVRDRVLLPVATVATRRTAYPLVSGAELVATLCDDHVSAQSLLPDGGASAWREWELEVAEDVADPRAVLRAVQPSLKAAGARRSREPSKVHRALGVEPGDRAAARSTGAGPDDDMESVLRTRLREQVAELQDQDAALRSGDPAAVHRMRIAARRTRAALTTCKPVLDEPTDALREELRWLGLVLGPARDAQVMRARIRSSLEALPPELVLGPVRRRLDVELRTREREALAAAREALDSERYLHLLEELDDLTERLAVSARGRGPAAEVVGQLVRRDSRRLRRAVEAAGETGRGPDHDATLHEARKKAKRLRYAAELAAPVGSARTSKLVRRAKAVQDALGRHQDTVMARQALRDLGVKSFLEGENGFTFGLLHGLEQAEAQRWEARFEDAWAKVPRPGAARRWVVGRHG
jgi:CHAD domain-containing protein